MFLLYKLQAMAALRSARLLLLALCGLSLFLYIVFYLPKEPMPPTSLAFKRIPSVDAMTLSLSNSISSNSNTANASVDEMAAVAANNSEQYKSSQPLAVAAAVVATNTTSAQQSMPFANRTAAKTDSKSSTSASHIQKVHTAHSSVMIDTTLHGVPAKQIYESGHIRPNPDVCPSLGRDVDLLILIMSAPGHVRDRLAIRHTWGHYKMRKDIAIAFVLGSFRNANLQVDVDRENQLYGDIIIGKFVDTYNNLTLKTISMLEWVDWYCPQANFILKTDDDMFINGEKLLHFIRKRDPLQKVIYGRLAKKWKPIRNMKSKYYVSPKQYASAIFPDFTTGPAYLLARATVHDLYHSALNHTYFKLEDVFMTGIVAHELQIKRVHVNEFLNKRISFNPCNVQKAISIHMIKYGEQFDLWKKLLDGKSKCK